MKMDEDTLVKYYDYELTTGWASNMQKATNVIIKRIESDGEEAMDAAKFFLSRRGKGLWSEQKNVEISGPDGGAIPLMAVDLDSMDYEALEQLDNILSQNTIEGVAVRIEDEDDGEDGED